LNSKNNLILFCFLILNISCTGYKNYVQKKSVINEISLIGNKHIKSGDLKANIPSLKYSYKRIVPAKYYLFLQSKRHINDSLNIKPKFYSFLTNYNPDFSLDLLTTIQTNLSKYYRKSGFLNNQIRFEIDSLEKNKKLVKVVFFIDEGPLSRYAKSDSLLIDNPVLTLDTKNYLDQHSLLEKNQGLTFDAIIQEKEKLTNYFKNKGYYFFTSDAIGIQINDLKDSTLERISLIYKIPDFKGLQFNRNFDRLYRFENPIFNIVKQSSSTNKIDKENLYQSKDLLKLINIKQGDLYSVDKVNQSLQNIYLTDQFKSVSIKFDTLKTKISPQFDLVSNDKYNFSSEFGGSLFRGIPGPFIANSFKVRRVFYSLDFIDFTTRIGFEAQTGFINTSETRRNLEINVGATLNFPSLFIPNNITKKLGILFAPQTQIGLNYDYIDRPEYIRTNVNLFNRILWRKSPYQNFSISFLDLNIINTNYPDSPTSKSFQNYLEELRLQGNNLIRSFNPSFVSSVQFNYSYRTFLPSNSLVNGKVFSFGFESGGTMLNFIPNKRIDFIERILGSKQELQFYRFLRITTDYRIYRLIGEMRKSQIAFKIGGGLAYAYGEENGFQLPYEKNFFIGGPSSLRAWKPRRLGPGSYNAGNNLIEQPGSILIESSLEYRFPLLYLLGKLNGALFVDAGNIWTFSNNQSNPNSVFNISTFYNQIAVGTGFGIRWDFSFFLLRLDIATKVINPAKPKNEKWVLDKTTLSSGENPLEFNIGIGYPF
jgi:outer membrane protein insertion porin family